LVNDYKNLHGHPTEQYLDSEDAKKCALKAVTQIINEYESNICNKGYDYDFEMWDMQRDYWREVQFEISKLKTLKLNNYEKETNCG
jgi:hypothetical protein